MFILSGVLEDYMPSGYICKASRQSHHTNTAQLTVFFCGPAPDRQAASCQAYLGDQALMLPALDLGEVGVGPSVHHNLVQHLNQVPF